jgi:hypothetical protein
MRSRYLLAPLLALFALVAGAASTVIQEGSSSTLYSGSGTANDEVVIQTNDVQRYNAFFLMSAAGAMDVFVSVDCTNYSTVALSLVDFGATDVNPVIVTVANRVYGFRGKFCKIRVLENGAAAVTSASLRAGIV